MTPFATLPSGAADALRLSVPGRLGFLLVTLWATAAAAISPVQSDARAAVLQLQPQPGSVRGLADEPSLDVFTAQVKYQVPIDLPAGVANLRPELAIVYDGALGNGALGLGWRLGLPQIRRVTRSGIPKFDANDMLELTGLSHSGRLVSLGQDRWAVAGQGRGVRVEALTPQATDARQAGGLAFYDGAGSRYVFGATADTRRGGPRGTEAWLLQSIENAQGAAITYSYKHSEGEADLQEIVWGPDSRFRVQLDYEARPDATIDYRRGYRAVRRRRLVAIRVRSQGEPLRTYRLAYAQGEGLSRLQSIEMLGRDGVLALPPVQLTYGSQNAGLTLPLTRDGAGGLGLFGRFSILADVDSDGLPDSVDLSSGEVRRNLGGGRFDRSRACPGLPVWGPEQIMAVDINGDGRIELVAIDAVNGTLYVYQYRPEGWLHLGAWAHSIGQAGPGEQLAVGDVNGDGLMDAIVNFGHNYHINWGGPEGFRAMGFSGGTLPDGITTHGGNRLRFVDVNGDGLVDAVAVGIEVFQVAYGLGDGTFAPLEVHALPNQVQYLDPSKVWTVDLDRDGLLDLVDISGPGQLHWYRGLASGGFAAEATHINTPNFPLAPEVTLADINGNGSVDVVWDTDVAMDIAGDTTAGMLVAVDNGMGETSHFTYSSTATLGRADETAGAAWDHRAYQAMQVPVLLSHEIWGQTAPLRQQLGVRDFIWDAAENRFAGFLSGTLTHLGGQPTATLHEAWQFHAGLGDDRVLRGQAYRHERRQGSATGPLLDATQSVWEAHRVRDFDLASRADSPLLRVPVLREQVVQHHEGESEPVALVHTHAHDDQGRLVTSVHHGRQGDDARITERRRYAATDSLWARDLVVETETLGAADTSAARTRHLFDGDAAGPLPFDRVTHGLPRETLGYLAEEGRWVRLAAQDYDRFGNPVRLYDAGIAREVRYDGDGLHPTQELLHPSPGRTLRWTMLWDLVAGLPVELRGPDGHADRLAYDGLGRVVAVARDDQPPHVRHAYDWRGPLPQTETTWQDGAAGTRQRIDVHDGRGRLRWHASALAPGSWQIDGVRAYDSRGRLASLTNAFISSAPLDADTQGARVPTHRLQYDALGRTRSVELPTGHRRVHDYGPLRETVHLPEQAPLQRHFDGHGRLVRSERVVAGTHEGVRADYDALGRLVRRRLLHSDAESLFHFDSLGRLHTTVDPEHGQRQQIWSDAGWLLQTENALGQNRHFSYDGIGRTLQTWRPGADDLAAELVTFQYDTAAHAANLGGHLAQVTEPLGTTRFSYDAFGRQERIDREIDGARLVERNSFAPSGLLLSTQWDDALSISRRYDALGRLVEVGPFWQAEAYDAADGLLQERYGNGLVQRTQRTDLHQPSTIRLEGSDGRALYDVSAAHAASGAIAALTDQDGVGLDHSAQFAFDDAARLTQASLAGFDFEYAYDGLQNLTHRGYRGPRSLPIAAGAYAYGTAPGHSQRQLSQAGDTHLAYDAAGRVAEIGTRRLSFDVDNRLRSVETPAGPEAYAYGYDGAQAWSKGNPGAPPHIRFNAQVSQTGRERVYLVQGAGRTLAQVAVPLEQAGATSPSQVEYVHATFAPGAALVTDADAAVVAERIVEPFGALLAGSTGGHAYNQDNKPIAARTGWSDHGSRWLAPELGQWLSPNPPLTLPITESLEAFWDLHPYQYARQNPLLFADPDGEAVQLIAGLMGAGTGALGLASHEIVIQFISPHPFDYGRIGAAAASGGAEGALIGLTGGASLLIRQGGRGAASAAGGAMGRSLRNESTSGMDVAQDFLRGMIPGGGSRRHNMAASKARSKPVLNQARQDKHIPGTNNSKNMENKSVWTHPDPRSIVERHMGKGSSRSPNIPYGQSGHREKVNFKTVVGIAKTKDGVRSAETTWGIICHSTKGYHVYPVFPD